jgi:glycogen debranching enzyme
MWSGWGIRTLSSDHVAYNPFSYHTGTVWPHDNSVIAGGFRRYGFDAEAAIVARGLFDAAGHFAAHRLPELFAGLEREEGAFPVQYLGANVPQAWAAASVFRLIAVLCGIRASADGGTPSLWVDPALPSWLPELTITNLRVGRGSVDLSFQGHEVTTLRNDSGYRVVRGQAPRPDARSSRRGDP